MENYKSNLWKMYAMKFFINFHMLASVLIPFYLEWGHLTFEKIMFLQSYYFMCAMLMDIPTGAFADRFGRKRALILAGAFYTSGLLVYVSFNSFAMFLVGETLWAAGMSFMSGADSAMVYDTLKKINREKDSKRIFQNVAIFSTLGILVAVPIGSLVGSKYGPWMSWALTSIAFFIATLICFTFVEPKVEEKKEKKRFLFTIKEGWEFFKSNKVVQVLAFDLFIVSSLGYLMIWIYQPLLKSVGVPVVQYGFVHAGLVALQIIIMLFYNKFEEAIGSKKGVMFIMGLMAGASILVAGLTKNVPMVIISIIISAAFGFTRQPIFSNYANKFISSDKRATVLSVVSMLGRLVLVITFPIVGLMVEWSLQKTLIILGILGIVLVLFSNIEEHHLID